MSRATQQVAQEIVDALQSRIAQWHAERQKIEVLRSRQDRKEERYNALGDLIAEAEAQISSASLRIATQESAADAASPGVRR